MAVPKICPVLKRQFMLKGRDGVEVIQLGPFAHPDKPAGGIKCNKIIPNRFVGSWPVCEAAVPARDGSDKDADCRRTQTTAACGPKDRAEDG